MVSQVGDRVLVLGTGRIASSLVKALRGTEGIDVDCRLPVTEAEDPVCVVPALVIVAEDGLTGTPTSSVDGCELCNIPRLVVSGRINRVFIGPLELPGVSGCSTCVNLRWVNSLRLGPLMAALGISLMEDPQMHLPLTVKDEDISILSEFVARNILSIIHGRTPVLVGKVWVMRTGADAVKATTVIPSEECRRCRSVVAGFGDAPVLPFRSHTIRAPEKLRVREISHRTLRNAFIDSDIGLISDTITQRIGDHVGVNARIKVPNGQVVSGFGIASTVEEAEHTAILESLERLCGRYPSQLTKSVVGTFSELAPRALHPELFGLHDDVIYGTHDRRYQPFRTDVQYRWVEGISCRNEEYVLVPEQLVYHRANIGHEPKFIQQTSSGCAVGNVFEEAVLYGLFEVLERDAFLNTWYTKLPEPEIAMDGMTGETYSSIDKLRKEGYGVRIFDISHDFMIPCVLAVAVHRRDEFPTFACGTATHLLAEVAIDKAVQELSAQVFGMQSATPERIVEAREKWFNPSKIRTISDHRLVGALPESQENWSFLLDAPSSITSTKDNCWQVNEQYRLASGDINAILQSVLNDVFDHGFDVIVVPLRRSEIAAVGLHAARVLVPGMLPMTFGHGYRRLKGLSRVLELPRKLGYSDRKLAVDDLNTSPHPFG